MWGCGGGVILDGVKSEERVGWGRGVSDSLPPPPSGYVPLSNTKIDFSSDLEKADPNQKKKKKKKVRRASSVVHVPCPVWPAGQAVVGVASRSGIGGCGCVLSVKLLHLWQC